VIPVITGATETISKSFRKYLSNVPGIHEIKELEKTVILGTAQTLGKVLMQKCNRFNTGASDVCTTNRNNTMAATLCSLWT
jgi:DNA-binding protein Fis